MGDWKLVKGGVPGIAAEGRKASIQGAELYNLAADVGEKNNLAAAQPEKVTQLAAAWDSFCQGHAGLPVGHVT